MSAEELSERDLADLVKTEIRIRWFIKLGRIKSGPAASILKVPDKSPFYDYLSFFHRKQYE